MIQKQDLQANVKQETYFALRRLFSDSNELKSGFANSMEFDLKQETYFAFGMLFSTTILPKARCSCLVFGTLLVLHFIYPAVR